MIDEDLEIEEVEEEDDFLIEDLEDTEIEKDLAADDDLVEETTEDLEIEEVEKKENLEDKRKNSLKKLASFFL
ncbi:TPA: hypothetical protein DEP21_01980 [Patescibacteria group bacterium]|nr:hypothetical protein [Candidatus Gracilibacteria bacterium]